ncbi:Kinesin-like protein klpA [Golovinomyces cichoracearum]|uniref:Kinesin-like protein n=1 Tax=Golovinomyces cichoracearum TaxID=62708 RepID=A0A420HK22_9PEZI|nr:Kinesin-like protein klpA [Golovinomyces cichoracearum]
MRSTLTSQKMEVDGNMHRSQLPQPRKFTTSVNCLSEVSESQSNIRNKQSFTPLPTNTKHKIMSNQSEPEPKRRTLVERAGEIISNKAPAMSGTRQNIKSTSLTRSKFGQPREAVFSNISHTKLDSNRDLIAGSFSCSIGPGIHPHRNYVQPQAVFSQSAFTKSSSGLSRTRQITFSSEKKENVVDTLREGKKEGYVEWDVEGRIKNMEIQFREMQETIKDASMDKKSLEESMTTLKARNAELETHQCQLAVSKQSLQSELDSVRLRSDISQQSLLDMTKSLNETIRSHQLEIEDIRRQNRNEVEKTRRDCTEEIDRLLRQNRQQVQEIEQRTASDYDAKFRELERQKCGILEDEKKRREQEIQEIMEKHASESASLSSELQARDTEIQSLRSEIQNIRNELNRERESKANASIELAMIKETSQKLNQENCSTIQTLEHSLASLRARIQFLESGSKAQSDSFAEMEERLEKALNLAKDSKEKLIKEESLRRNLFNQVQELKGNIRVMCRVRPILSCTEGDAVKIKIPDLHEGAKELELVGKEEKSCLGTVTRKVHSFTFDRVFGPESHNQEVFEEISQLVQSALDGYNVCIFCYGQTGSGKTHTMSSSDGMIPLATQQIYETATSLEAKGWIYKMEGNFVEVYNEEIHDLLCSSREHEKKKHEIRHDDQKKQTIVTGLNTVTLDSPSSVELILKKAAANRSVAATKANERSSRSHSVFMLKLVGHNTETSERSEGTLNLVDLAGSERLKHSGAEGDRMKETQSINKSLSCLGDVIGALGQGKSGAHIPYRNSKLTYLLQYSLGGNSKSLMFVMASPLEAHLSETITSLKFATKVQNTHIGTAKKTRKHLN